MMPCYTAKSRITLALADSISPGRVSAQAGRVAAALLASAAMLAPPCGCSPLDHLATTAPPPADAAADDANEASAARVNAPMPLVHAGPDISLALPCDGFESRPVASVANLGGRCFTWSADVEGDPAFTLKSGTMLACPGNPTSVVMAQFQAPVDSTLGSTFDAVVTVHALDDAFPAASVSLHAEIVPVDVTVTPTDVDFGRVANTYSLPWLPVRFFNGNEATLQSRHDETSLPAFLPPPDMPLRPREWNEAKIEFVARGPGAFSSDLSWTFSANPAPVPAGPCAQTVTVHVHGVIGAPVDGGAEAHAEDGAVRDAPADAGGAP